MNFYATNYKKKSCKVKYDLLNRRYSVMQCIYVFFCNYGCLNANENISLRSLKSKKKAVSEAVRIKVFNNYFWSRAVQCSKRNLYIFICCSAFIYL